MTLLNNDTLALSAAPIATKNSQLYIVNLRNGTDVQVRSPSRYLNAFAPIYLTMGPGGTLYMSGILD